MTAVLDRAVPAGEAVPSLIEELTEEECYLVAILMDQSGLDLAEFAWVDQESDDGCYRAYPYQWSWWRCDEQRQVDHCVGEGQLVLAERGYVPIETIEVGERVLTHRGGWRTVLRVLDRGVQPVVSVRGQGHPGLVVTADHPLLSRRARRSSAPKDGTKAKKLLPQEWRTPRDWEWCDESGTMNATWASPASAAPLPHPPQMEAAYRSGIQNLVGDVLSPEWLWLYGLYLAEGSVYVPKRADDKTYRTTWSVHEDEAADVEAMLDKVGLRHRTVRNGGRGVNVVVTSKPVTQWLAEHGGRGSINKRLASWAYGLDDERRGAIWDGASYGDGHHRNGRVEYSTTSPALAYGYKLLSHSLGKRCSVYRAAKAGSSTILGRTVSCHDSLIVAAGPLTVGRRNVLFEDGQAWAPVTKITAAGETHVWDLEVDEDHSFIVEGVTVHNCSRSTGKSESVAARACAFPFNHPGEEFAITAPEGIHVGLLTDRVESRLENTRLLREMLKSGSGRGSFKHRPFQADFKNSTRIVSRLPQRDGKGMKGLHCVELHIDEAQDFPQPAWDEIRETLKRDVAGAQMRVHGVTRGIPDEFDRISRPGSGWRVHRLTQLHKPTWTDEELQQKIEEYGGSIDAPEFRRNVLGIASDSDNAIFIVTRLLRCTDTEETSLYNSEEFQEQYIVWEQVEEEARSRGAAPEEYGEVLAEMINLPLIHTERYKHFWGGMDVGITTDPSAVMIFAEYQPDTAEKARDRALEMAVPLDGASRLKLLSRIEMRRAPVPAQVKAVMGIIDFYRPKAFAIDKTGNGMGILQGLQQAALESKLMRVIIEDDEGVPEVVESARRALTVIKGYNFGGKTLVGFDESIMEDLDPKLEIEEIIKEAGLFQQAKEAATDVARLYVDTQRLYLPYDEGAKTASSRSLIRQMTGQTWSYNKSLTDKFGNRQKSYSEGQFHAFDGLRMALLAHALQPIEDMVEQLKKPKTRQPVPVYFM